MSNLKIYDDQHGKMIYPVVGATIDERMKMFFNKKIRLYIEKTINVHDEPHHEEMRPL